MIKTKIKTLYRIGGVILVIVLGSFFNGCSELGGIKSDSDYKNLALETLEERYGEKFKIKQLGGTFGALNDTKKLVCYPLSNPDKYCFVEVEKDLSEVHDNYINRIMEEKLNEYLLPYAEEIFGREVNIKSFFDNRYNKYISTDMSIVEFMSDNKRCGYALDIFIKGGESLNKEEEAQKIERFMNKIIESKILNSNYCIIRYLKDDHYEMVNSKYYGLNFDGNEVKYYKNPDFIYNQTSCEISGENLINSVKEIENNFEY